MTAAGNYQTAMIPLLYSKAGAWTPPRCARFIDEWGSGRANFLPSGSIDGDRRPDRRADARYSMTRSSWRFEPR
jgi:hypothetical protein